MTPSSAQRRLIILTEGHTEPITGKTAACLVRYRPSEVAALLDSTQAGKTAGEVLGVGGDVPIVAQLSEVPDATALAIGIAPPGGKIPASWRSVILEAIQRGLSVISGLHEFLCDDPEFAAAAAEHGVE
ncbi:MAG: DUF1611 domain-containing protein, partial [Planctomycetales bacterium]|nr:DUF1611 domain-containing protein [Planctomycetales bacterium]